MYNNNAKNVTEKHEGRIRAVRNATKNLAVTSQILAEKAIYGYQEIKDKKESAKNTYRNIKNFFN